MKKIINSVIYLLLLVSFISCKKTKGFNSLTDTKPEVLVLVANVYDYLPSPTVKLPKLKIK